MMEPVHILHVVCFSHPYGVQRSILSTARSLDVARFRASVAAPPDEDFEAMLREAGVPFFPTPMAGLFDVGAVRRLARCIREQKVGIVHAHLGISSFLGLLASRRAGGMPVVVTRHFLEDRYTTIPNPLLRAVYRRVYGWMNRRFARIVFVSDAVGRAVTARERVAPKRCRIVPNGIPLKPESPLDAAAERAAWRTAAGLPPDAKVVFTLSRLCAEKDVTTLLQAAPAVLDSAPETYFAIYGDGPLAADLKALAERLGVAGHVLFLGYQPDAAKHLPAGDVFALSAFAEPFGISILEAMAAGLPVVAANSAGPAEILRGGKDGLLFEPRDPTTLAGCLIRALTDASLRADLAARSLRRVRDFEERTVAARMEEIYQEVLK